MGHEKDPQVVATALAISYFESKLQKDKNTWELIVEKAKSWLATKLGGEDKADELLAKAAALLKSALAEELGPCRGLPACQHSTSSQKEHQAAHRPRQRQESLPRLSSRLDSWGAMGGVGGRNLPVQTSWAFPTGFQGRVEFPMSTTSSKVPEAYLLKLVGSGVMFRKLYPTTHKDGGGVE
ncbi:hypothetical protein BGW41_007504 [Actinomortierella wolfii]|nr:hypothetical protein BGW41_007504 [Actinomortierella wolfii]